MAYVIDRNHVLRDTELVAVLAISQRGSKSQLCLSDGSLIRTLTRPGTLIHTLDTCRKRNQGLAWINDRRSDRP